MYIVVVPIVKLFVVVIKKQKLLAPVSLVQLNLSTMSGIQNSVALRYQGSGCPCSFLSLSIMLVLTQFEHSFLQTNCPYPRD